MSGGFPFQAVISPTPRHSTFKSFTLAAEPAGISGAHLDQSIQHALSQYNDQLPLQEASTIPASWYTDPRIGELERGAVFGANWQCVARVEQVAQPGQYVAVQVAGEPVVVVRGADGSSGHSLMFADIMRRRLRQSLAGRCSCFAVRITDGATVWMAALRELRNLPGCAISIAQRMDWFRLRSRAGSNSSLCRSIRDRICTSTWGTGLAGCTAWRRLAALF